MKPTDIDDRGLSPDGPDGPDPSAAAETLVCPECQGAGSTPVGEACPMCEGTGRAGGRVGGG
jgi:hypothetical protein